MSNIVPVLFRAIDADPVSALLVISVLFAVVLLTSGEVVRLILTKANIDIPTSESDEERQRRDTGTIIGKIENLLVVFLVLLGEYTALSVIFAGKSLVRRDNMGGEDSSYYLTGTITNFTYSLIWALFTNYILRYYLT